MKVDPADARDATHFRRIRAAVTGNAPQAAVAATRAAGDSLAVTGLALGTSRRAAEERFYRTP